MLPKKLQHFRYLAKNWHNMCLQFGKYYFCYLNFIYPKPMIMKKTLTVLFFSMMAMTMTWSQSVDGIISKYFETVGGVERWKTMKTVKMKGSMPTPQGDFAFEMLRKAPNKSIMSLDIMGQKMVAQAFDGTTAWMLNPFTGESKPQKLPEDQAKSIIDGAEFEDPFIDYVKKGYEITYEGTADVDGVKCYVLQLTKNKGKGDQELISSYYLDCETYLPLMVKQMPEPWALWK
jgi:outer membrane lipoprotein-sorting protein